MDLHAHSGADPIGFDRETRLQCGFLMWCYNLIVPKAKSDSAARPQSAYNMLAGVRRVHRRENMQMVAASRLAAVMKGITAQFIAENGAEALLPNRKEPIEPDPNRRWAEVTALGAVQLCWGSPLFLCLGAMIALAASTGFRKAEVALPSGVAFDDRRLRRSSLLREIDGVIVADPSPEALRGLVRGRDKALIKPPRSKADQDGTKFGALPIYLPFDESDPANAARWLQRLELRYPCTGSRRAATPLFFSNAAFAPMLHSTVDTYLLHLLRLHVSPESLPGNSFHSFRIGFACALLAAGCPPGMIQALARWRSTESLAIYARLNPSDYVAWTAKALTQRTTSTTTRRLPCAIDNDALIASFADAGGFLDRAGRLGSPNNF
jgi:integrase